MPLERSKLILRQNVLNNQILKGKHNSIRRYVHSRVWNIKFQQVDQLSIWKMGF